MTAETALAKKDPMGSALANFNPKDYNLCAPLVTLDRVPDQFRISVRTVLVDPEVETYPIPGEKKDDPKAKVGISKVALDKLAAAAGIQWIPAQCGEIPHNHGPHYVHYKAVGTMRNFDGEIRVLHAEKVIDLRGKPGDPEDQLGTDAKEFVRQAEKKQPTKWDIPKGARSSDCRECNKPIFWVDTPRGKKVPCDPDGTCHFDTCEAKADKGDGNGWDRVYQARQNIHSLAESKAKNRAIRQALAIPVALPKNEVAKPFVIPALVLCPDMSDPDVKRAAIAHMFGAQALLYGAPAPSPALAALPSPAPAGAPRDTFVDPESGEILVEADPTPPTVEKAVQPAQPAPSKSSISQDEFERIIFGDEKEPWDEEEQPKKAPRFILTPEELSATGNLDRWFSRINELVQAMYDRFGVEVGAEKLSAVFPKDWDPERTPSVLSKDDVKRLGAALVAAAGGR